MNNHTLASNTPLLNAHDNEEPQKSSFFPGQSSTSVFTPPQGLSLIYNPSTNPDEPFLNSRVPPEILIQVFKSATTRDLLHCTQVCRQWCECAVELLWQRPVFLNPHSFDNVVKMSRVLAASRQTYTYARFIRHLELPRFSFRDDVLLPFHHCDNIEYLDLNGWPSIPEELLIRVFPRLENLTTIDLEDCPQITDDLLIHLAQTAKRLEDIRLDDCKQITDEGVLALAGSCPDLRRIKLVSIFLITDLAVTSIAKSCPLLAQIKLGSSDMWVTDLGVRSLWQHSTHLRELGLFFCSALTNNAFPALPPRSKQLGVLSDANIFPHPPSPGSEICGIGGTLPPLILNHSFNQIQQLELSGGFLLTDDVLEGIIFHAPNIQHLTVIHCLQLTNRAVEAICKLGESLQFLRFGYPDKIKDSTMQLLSRSCTKLQSLDIGTCSQITLETIHLLLQKLGELTSLYLVLFPPFWDLELQKSYRKACGHSSAGRRSPENQMDEGCFQDSEITQLRDFLRAARGVHSWTLD